MNLNATLLAQTITFFLFAWFTMKLVWPPIMKAVDERRQKIADGLALAEKGHKDIELAQAEAKKILRDTREQATSIVEQANRRHAEIVDAAAADARKEAERIVAGAKAEVHQEVERAREQLRTQVGVLAVNAAEKILQRGIDATVHADLVNKLAQEL